LLNAAERVEQAFGAITKGQIFTEEQQKWLQRIRTHLQQDLSIDKTDFEEQPTFADYGGWGRAARVFQGQLPALIKELNRAIAA
jgi:type I restriction enzyme R subunit